MKLKSMLNGIKKDYHLSLLLVIKGFNQPKAPGTEVSAEKMMLPDANLLAERNLLANMKSIKSLKQSGLSGVFTGQAVSAFCAAVLWKCSLSLA